MKALHKSAVAGLVVAVALPLLASCGLGIGDTGGGGQARRQSVPVPAWGGLKVHSVCVEGAATFEGQPANEEAVQILKEGLRRWGIATARPGGACDATMRMEFTGRALSGTYIGHEGVLYTGFTISGQKTLSAPNLPTLTYPFTSSETPPLAVRSGSSIPRDALKVAVAAHYDDCVSLAYSENGCHAMAYFFGPFKGQPVPTPGSEPPPSTGSP